MANKIIQATALPTGEQAQLILTDNGDGTYTETVAFDRDTYPSRAADIVAGSLIVAGGAPGLLPAITGLRYPQAFGRSVAAGDVDLYTAPAGKRALVGMFVSFNPTIGAITIFWQIKINGVYFRLTANVSNTPNTANGTLGIRYILEPGESLAVNTSALGLNIGAKIIEYDNTVPIYAPKLLALANGNNTLYTVPAGKTALPLSNLAQSGVVVGSDFIQGFAAPVYSNVSGGARIVTFSFTPSGQSAAQISAATSVNDNTVNSNSCQPP